ncbi:MAG: hypothetical protein KGH63_02800 [Candidatus Micrarchaeota archaeon]|nr:hypothetical protein [Candidatus Micrarchaeota archaeon]
MKRAAIVLLFLVAGLLLAGCAGSQNPGADNSANQSANISISITNASQGSAEAVARAWLAASAPTFVFDGMPGTLRLVATGTHREPAMGRPCQVGKECWQACYPQACWTFTYAFDSRQGGYGNRTGQMLAQVITPHQTEIRVDPVKMRVMLAVTDGTFDEMSGQMVQTGAGGVISGNASAGSANASGTGNAGAGSGSPGGPAGGLAVRMTAEYCASARGDWNGTDCLCGGIAGFGCPGGYGCADMRPSPETPDAMGVCRPNLKTGQN